MTVDYSLWMPVVVIEDDNDEEEPLGTKEKAWVTHEADGTRWLLKFARERHGRVMGEDWAEWISARLGKYLGIPCAEVHPAQVNSRRGIISKNIVSLERSERLVHGNSLLAEKDPNYVPTASRENPLYTVSAVQNAMRDMVTPDSWEGPSLNAFSVWSGYLLFDALTAGRDRHHENWGAITTPEGSRLAESYDHGNGLGFQESSDKHRRLLESPQAMESWLKRGKSHHFAGKPTLVDLAVSSLSLAGYETVDWWQYRLANMEFEALEAIVENVPDGIMSEVSRRFVLKLLQDNQRRLLDALANL